MAVGTLGLGPVTQEQMDLVIDPLKQPAFWVPNQHNPAHAYLYNHYLEPISGGAMGQIDTFGYWTNTYGNDFNERFGYSGSSSLPGTNSGYWLNSGFGHQNYFGHRYFELMPDMTLSRRGDPNAAVASDAWRFMGNIVSDETAYAHKYVIGVDDDYLVISPASARLFGEYRNSSVLNAKRVRITASGRNIITTGRQTVWGGISYNAKTKTLAILEREGTTTGYHWLKIFTGVDHPGQYAGRVDEWLDHINVCPSYVSSVETGWAPLHNATITDDTRYRAIIVMTDVGTAYYYRYYADWGAGAAYWEFDGSSISDPTNWWSRSWTTSYTLVSNFANGGGIQWNISNDSRYIWVYSHAYHYHGGFYGQWIDVQTGRAIGNYFWHTSTPGYLVPIAKSAFLIGTGDNSDGAGLRGHIAHFEDHWQWRGGSTQQRIISNTSPFLNNHAQWLPAPYHSTAYPMAYTANYDRALIARSI